MFKKLELLPPLAHDLIVDFIGCIFTSLGLYNFASQSGFLPGGISGVSLIIQHYIPSLSLGVLNLMLNIPLVIFAFFFLGRNFLLRSMRTVLVLSITLDFLAPLLPTYSHNPLLSAIFGGCFVGLGLGIIFSNHSSTGGADLIVMSLKKLRPHLSLGTITMLIDGVIILAGGFVFGNIEAVLNGVVFTFFVTRAMDSYMSGAQAGKLAMIITDHGKGLGREIESKVQRGATLINATGSYTGNKKEIVMCALSRQQLPKLRQVVTDFDPAALLIVLEYNEVFGTGFQSFVEKH